MTKKAEAFFKRHMFAALLLIALIAAMLYCIPFNVSLEMSSFETVAEFVLIVVPALTALFLSLIHISRSLLAVRSGGLTGEGYLHGLLTQNPSKNFLPERYTDFIFSTLSLIHILSTESFEAPPD